ncbi:hypothetical protein HK100_008987 [Physocladia obscura]|uniref:3'-5' exonuclease domain-containing protein n=1 Tax=Physocladia obscura TaxID=109957 RepID=A0AAD5XH66_9FUNG|nr:hypothetical protein HK100_008987 [Physocladia obscura]
MENLMAVTMMVQSIVSDVRQGNQDDLTCNNKFAAVAQMIRQATTVPERVAIAEELVTAACRAMARRVELGIAEADTLGANNASTKNKIDASTKTSETKNAKTSRDIRITSAAAFQRRIFKTVGILVAAAVAPIGNRKRKRFAPKSSFRNTTAGSSSNYGEINDSGEDDIADERGDGDDADKQIHNLLRRLLIAQDAISPLAVHILTALPHAGPMISGDNILHHTLLKNLFSHKAMASDVFMLLNPPFFIWPTNIEDENSIEISLPRAVLDAIVFLVRAGFTSVATFLATRPNLANTVLLSLDKLAQRILSDDAAVAISAIPSLSQRIALRNMISDAKFILKIGLSCIQQQKNQLPQKQPKKQLGNVKVSISDQLEKLNEIEACIQLNVPSVISCARINSVNWLVIETIRYFSSIGNSNLVTIDNERNTVVKDRDIFLEGPLMLIPDLLLLFVDQNHRIFATKYAVSILLGLNNSLHGSDDDENDAEVDGDNSSNVNERGNFDGISEISSQISTRISGMSIFEPCIIASILQFLLIPLGFPTGEIKNLGNSNYNYTSGAWEIGRKDFFIPSKEWRWVKDAYDDYYKNYLIISCLNENSMVGIKSESNEEILGEEVSTKEAGDGEEAQLKETKFYASSVPVVFVSDVESFAQFEKATIACNCIVLDCEWKPDSFKLIGETDNPAATLQIALCHFVGNSAGDVPQCNSVQAFVLGLKELDEADVVRVVGALFKSCGVLKLDGFAKILISLEYTTTAGFGFHQEDFARIRQQYPAFPLEINNLIDLSKITTAQKARGCFGNKKRVSLAEVARNYLNVDLEKRVRLSNWEMRPLTKRQIAYAAADSLVLLEIYVEIVKNGDLIDENIGGGSTKEKKKKDRKEKGKKHK